MMINVSNNNTNNGGSFLLFHLTPSFTLEVNKSKKFPPYNQTPRFQWPWTQRKLNFLKVDVDLPAMWCLFSACVSVRVLLVPRWSSFFSCAPKKPERKRRRRSRRGTTRRRKIKEERWGTNSCEGGVAYLMERKRRNNGIVMIRETMRREQHNQIQQWGRGAVRAGWSAAVNGSD